MNNYDIYSQVSKMKIRSASNLKLLICDLGSIWGWNFYNGHSLGHAFILLLQFDDGCFVDAA